jgi:hypothetical protein
MADQTMYLALQVRLHDRALVSKYLYIKRHANRETTASPDTPALFVAGLPFRLTKQHLHSLFETFGAIDQVCLQHVIDTYVYMVQVAVHHNARENVHHPACRCNSIRYVPRQLLCTNNRRLWRPH